MIMLILFYEDVVAVFEVVEVHPFEAGCFVAITSHHYMIILDEMKWSIELVETEASIVNNPRSKRKITHNAWTYNFAPNHPADSLGLHVDASDWTTIRILTDSGSVIFYVRNESIPDAA